MHWLHDSCRLKIVSPSPKNRRWTVVSHPYLVSKIKTYLILISWDISFPSASKVTCANNGNPGPWKMHNKLIYLFMACLHSLSLLVRKKTWLQITLLTPMMFTESGANNWQCMPSFFLFSVLLGKISVSVVFFFLKNHSPRHVSKSIVWWWGCSGNLERCKHQLILFSSDTVQSASWICKGT